MNLTNIEIAENLAAALKAWRVSPAGAGMTQEELAHKSGIGLTPLKRFEKTGAITLRNLIAILRAMDLLEGLVTLVPDADNPSPLDVLMEEQKKAKQRRKRAPRSKKDK
ncbi:MAG: helix-turn-helix transcriptional regulator [Pseudomonadota bacterium]